MPRKLGRGWKQARGRLYESIEDPRSRLFAALACDQRIEILKLLRDGEKCTCDMAPHLRVDISVVSRHLTVLKSLGLIVSRKEGVSNYYSVEDQRIFNILDTALEILKDMTERHRDIFSRL